MIAAIEKTCELLVLKRVSVTSRQTTRMKLPASVQGQMPQGGEVMVICVTRWRHLHVCGMVGSLIRISFHGTFGVLSFL